MGIRRVRLNAANRRSVTDGAELREREGAVFTSASRPIGATSSCFRSLVQSLVVLLARRSVLFSFSVQK